MARIPCIDLTPFRAGDPRGRAAVARQWGEAFEGIGFATVVGHGVSPEKTESAYGALMRFFDLSLAEKTAWSVADRVKSRGYLPVGIESVARTRGDDRPADLCEALVFAGINNERPGALSGLRSETTGNLYPSNPPQLADAMRAYFMEVYQLLTTLLQLSACALSLQEDFFAPYFDRRRATLRCVHYPAQAVEPEPGQLRYGAHSDYGALTVLRQDDAPGGLQAYTVQGEWVDVPPTPGSYVINIGDLMARWTNDRWRSTLHRVVNPPRDARGPTRRLSLVLFSGPNPDAVISCLPSCVDHARPAKYPPVRADEYIQAKLDSSMPESLRGGAAS